MDVPVMQDTQERPTELQEVNPQISESIPLQDEEEDDELEENVAESPENNKRIN